MKESSREIQKLCLVLTEETTKDTKTKPEMVSNVSHGNKLSMINGTDIRI